jgi:hypothetical protein
MSMLLRGRCREIHECPHSRNEADELLRAGLLCMTGSCWLVPSLPKDAAAVVISHAFEQNVNYER